MRILAFFELIYLFFLEVTLSSLKLIWIIYTRPLRIESGFYELDLKVSREWQQILIAHFVTLTPGTVSVDLIPKEKKLLIHFLELKDKEDTIAFIKNKLEPLAIRLGGRSS